MARHHQCEALLIKRYGDCVLVIAEYPYREIWAVFSNKSEAKAWIAEHLQNSDREITESQLPESEQRHDRSRVGEWPRFADRRADIDMAVLKRIAAAPE
jgi:hypothetical protein